MNSDDVHDDDEDSWSEYESGPFCVHWGDASDCTHPCVCGHSCHVHWDLGCNMYDCGCKGFQDATVEGE